jgi:hypothetical protein
MRPGDGASWLPRMVWAALARMSAQHSFGLAP